jgi:tetratricopeptide (TPR) repeat protein
MAGMFEVISQRRIIVTAVLASLCGLATGCSSLPPQEREALIRASDQYQKGDSAGAVQQLDRLIRDYENAPEIAEAHYLRGLCRIKEGQITAAADDFQAAIVRSNRPDLVSLCKASLAGIAYRQSEWGRAADLYAEAAPALSDEPPTDQILYSAGIAMQRAGKWREAEYQFGRILRRFPNSSVAANARALAGWPHDYFTIQLGVFANAEHAAKVAQSYRARGLQAVQENLPRNGQVLWFISVGRYSTYADAQAGLAEIRRVEPAAFVLP